MQKQNKRLVSSQTRYIIATLMLTVFIFSSCRKEVCPQDNSLQKPIPKMVLAAKTNPFSLKNVTKAKAAIAAKSQLAGIKHDGSGNANALTNGFDDGPGSVQDTVYSYFRFDATQITTEQTQMLEADNNMQLMQIPMGDGALYDEDLNLDENMAEQLKDGYIYGVANMNDPIVATLLAAPNLQAQQLDILVKPTNQTDPILILEALRQAYLTDHELTSAKAQAIANADYPTLTNIFGICLFKKPHGYVKYQDNDLNRMEPVRGMQVWALFFGIPITTTTDGNGYYEVPWRFSLGTIMGTKAKNNRVNVKPLDTHSDGFINNALSIVLDFVVGSVHIDGWIGACGLKNDHNFDFTGHTQVRYWSQILNAYYFHDQFCAAEGILNAPQAMVCYAQWANPSGFGSASTPMLSQITGGQYTDPIIAVTVGFTPLGVILSVIHGLLPDMSFKVSGNIEPNQYNSRLAQTAFHELGHASMYRQVGASWHLGLDVAELLNVTDANGYGELGYSGSGKVQLGEAWAEFIGTFHANIRYGTNGFKQSRQRGLIDFSHALEDEAWYNRNWIYDGLFYDLMDFNNTNRFEDESAWDRVGGATIQQMYSAFNPYTIEYCGYQSSFLTSYAAFSNTATMNLFDHYQACR